MEGGGLGASGAASALVKYYPINTKHKYSLALLDYVYSHERTDLCLVLLFVFLLFLSAGLIHINLKGYSNNTFIQKHVKK